MSIEKVHNETREKMQKSLDVLQHDLDTIQTGRANPAILEGVMVDYYGTPTPLTQVCDITSFGPGVLKISPYGSEALPSIEKAICSLRSNLGITPQINGLVMYLPIPPLNSEAKKESVIKIRERGEQSKLSIKNDQRDANDQFKRLEEDKEISQDDEKINVEKIQKTTDTFIKQVDRMMEDKETELM